MKKTLLPLAALVSVLLPVSLFFAVSSVKAGSSTIFLPLVVQPNNQAGRPWPDSNASILVYDDQLDLRNLTPAQVQFAALHLAGSQKLTRDQARLLRQVNPNFLVLHYRLGQALGHSMPDSNCAPTTNYIQIVDGSSWVREWPASSTLQENWLFHYNGQRVFQCAWGHYLMDLNDPGWRTWWSSQVIQQLQDNEDDGVFADSYSIPNYLGPWKPSLPTVDSTFEAEWAVREHQFSDYIESQFAGRWKWIPNIGAYITTRDPSDESNLDGAMIEGFAEWGSGNYFATPDWELQMNRVIKLVGADKILIGQTYPDENDVNERLFILGTYLLVKGHHTYINLETSMAPEWFPEYNLDLGAPLDALPAEVSAYWKPAWGVYARQYTKGMVLVNPDDSPHSFSLGKTLYQAHPNGGGEVPANGQAPGSLSYPAVTSLNLDAHQAAILLNQVP